MTANAPDPTPPPGKPRIGVAWIIVAVVGALVVAAWLYFTIRPTPPPQDNRRAPATSTTVP